MIFTELVSDVRQFLKSPRKLCLWSKNSGTVPKINVIYLVFVDDMFALIKTESGMSQKVLDEIIELDRVAKNMSSDYGY